jgi:WD40 repeat protein
LLKHFCGKNVVTNNGIGGDDLINRNKCKQANSTFILLLFILSSLFLGACAAKEQPKQKNPIKTERTKVAAASLSAEWKLPISIPAGQGEFYKVAGWYNDQQIFYVTNLDQTSNLFLYNLLTGKSKLIYKTENPIVNVQISPSKKYLLIHSSPSSYQGLVTIIDSKGTERLKKTFPSYDLGFEWNPYNETQVIVTKFAEDWSFQLYLLDFNSASTTELKLPQPFIKWIKKDELAYLNWDLNSPSLVAPLIVKKLGSEVDKTVFSKIIQFDAYRDLLMTVAVKEGEPSMGDYSFFDKEQKKLFSFSVPQLSKFSDWLVPFYDYSERKKQFITLRPLTSGEADTYTEGFQLIRYDLKKGSGELILSGLENVPISVSPSGDTALLGNSYEKLIDLNKKKSFDLIKE